MARARRRRVVGIASGIVVIVAAACGGPQPASNAGDSTTTAYCTEPPDVHHVDEGVIAVDSGEPDTDGFVVGGVAECVLEHAYGRCVDACYQDGAYCPQFSGPGYAFLVCAINCYTVDDCPAPEPMHSVRCHIGSCYLDCEDAECPDGMQCTQFADMPGLVCMFPG